MGASPDPVCCQLAKTEATGIVTGANSNHSVNAQVAGYPTGCLVFGIGNGVLIGDTDPTSFVVGVKPADYPPYRTNAAACSIINPTGGRWGNVTDLTLTVQGCAVPVEEKTWGGRLDDNDDTNT